MRRPDAGHGRHDGQPAVSQRRGHRLPPADPLAAARQGVLGVATCDKGLPAMMMALAGDARSAGVLVPGGVTLPPREGEDAGKIQSIGARFAHGELTLEEAAELGCRACASPGGGCQFLGTAATSQVVAEALGMTLPHAALAPSGQPIWLDMARRSARRRRRIWQTRKIHDAAHSHRRRHPQRHGRPRRVRRLDQPAAPHPGHRLRRRPAPAHGRRLARGQSPGAAAGRALPNGPFYHPTVRVFLAGGVPEVMLHLRGSACSTRRA